MSDLAIASEPQLSTDTLKRFVHGGIVYDQDKGLGAVPEVARIAYYGLVVLMRPSVFLSLVPPLTTDNDKLAPLMDDGQPISMGFLVVNMADEDLRVRQHEGRHRTAHILRRNGDEEIPVAFLFNGGEKARDISEEDVARICQGLRRERSSEERDPPVIEGPLFDRVLHLGQDFRFSEQLAPAFP